MKPKEGTIFWFTQHPRRACREGASPCEVTKYSLDSSYSLKLMIGQMERRLSSASEHPVCNQVCSAMSQGLTSGRAKWRASIASTGCAAVEVSQARCHSTSCQLTPPVHWLVQDALLYDVYVFGNK